MSNKFQKLEYMKVYKGNGTCNCQVDAQHAKPPKADLLTGRIVENIVKKTQCAGIISTISRTDADLNRKTDGQNNEAVLQYREVMKEILEHLGILDIKNHMIVKPFLHLTIHGMKDEHYGPYAIEIGTFNGQSCSTEIKKWFRKTIISKSKEILPKIRIRFDEYFVGDESIVFHRLGDGVGYPGYGQHFHTIQIEFSRTLREKHFHEMIELLSQIILFFQSEVVKNN